MSYFLTEKLRGKNELLSPNLKKQPTKKSIKDPINSKWTEWDRNRSKYYTDVAQKKIATRNIRFQFLNITYSYGLQDKENKDDKTSI